ncbi:hypothetical protein CAPTEDRAFT_167009 [Capitella teleta]|uniref:Ig-like domain-containing protein n=1 Tax=Capitella teleta TaxID=283909 RepID=R7V800_CAPTE|nr:hypothetical protein CAPTEDRAFT_167009 [Capitella teleta]|eukprot:ELU14988.1 hypothetical protein CAPTEDRAFT_167009 [Capitella teleta]
MHAFFLVGILAALFCSARGQDPTVTIKLTEPASISNVLIEAERDQDVTLDCYVENLPATTTPRWQWVTYDSNGKAQTKKISQDTAIEDNTKHSIEKPTEFTWRLRVKAIQVSDEGNYTCYVQTTLQNRKFDNRTISVLVPPSLDPAKTSTDTTVDAGESVDLMCNASGRPTPTIEWTRLGGALLPGKGPRYSGSTLSISNIQPQDRGKYRCTVVNQIGSTRQEIELGVRFEPIVTAVNPVVYQKKGCLIELQCLAESNPFPREEGLSWIKDSTTYSVSTSRYEVRAMRGAFSRLSYDLIISEVRSEDFGTYQCRIRNSIGTTLRQVTLIESDEAQPSFKFGRTICGGENIYSGSGQIFISALILLSSLVLSLNLSS